MNVENAPKDVLRYVGRFLDLRDLMVCRRVCKKWKEIIDDSTHDDYIFKHFTFENDVTDFQHRAYYQAAKKAFIVAKNIENPHIQMDEHVPLKGNKRHCSGECCGGCCSASYSRNGNEGWACLLLFFACITCCCCCCCCGTQRNVPFM